MLHQPVHVPRRRRRGRNDWQFPFLDDETFATLTGDWERSNAALLGRRSFEGFDEVRRSAPDSPVIGFLASVARYVVSRPTYEPAWEGTTRAVALWAMTNDEATD